MNGRLAFSAVVGFFPFGPVEPVEDFVEHPDGMVVRNSLVNAGLKEDDLFSLHWRRLPVTGVHIFSGHFVLLKPKASLRSGFYTLKA